MAPSGHGCWLMRLSAEVMWDGSPSVHWTPSGAVRQSPGLTDVFVDTGCDAAAGSEQRLNMETSASANVVVMRSLFLARLLRY